MIYFLHTLRQKTFWIILDICSSDLIWMCRANDLRTLVSYQKLHPKDSSVEAERGMA